MSTPKTNRLRGVLAAGAGHLEDTAGDEWFAQHLREQPLEEALRDALYLTMGALARYEAGKPGHRDGRYLLEAFAALQRHARLSSPRLAKRVGYTIRPDLTMPADIEKRVTRPMGRIASDLVKVHSMSHSSDLPALRNALQMGGPDRAPNQSRAAALHRTAVVLVADSMERMIHSQAKYLAGGGAAPTVKDVTQIFSTVGRAINRDFKTVRSAWLKAIDSNARWHDLYEQARLGSANVKRMEVQQTTRSAPAAKKKPDRSKLKSAIDRDLRKQ